MNITETPWGRPQHQTLVGPGLTVVSTASHGGIHLDQARVYEMRLMLPQFEPFAGYPWLEEDCDVAVAVVLWPDHFSAEHVRGAVRQLQGMDKACMRAWFQTEAGRRVRLISDRWEKEHKGQWERAGGCSHELGWIAWLYEIGSGREQERLFPSYPEKNLYTSAELEAVSRAVPAPEPVQNRRLAVTFQPEDCGGVFDGVGTVYSDADPGL